MKYIFRAIRWPLGQLIIFINWATKPTPVQRDPEDQAEVNRATASMALYQFNQCPFCVRTRRKFHQLALEIETRDARNDPKWNSELINEGGKYQVPCLRIIEDDGTVRWVYESSKITGYLEKRFSVNN